jgi:type VI protein secretion system component VasK
MLSTQEGVIQATSQRFQHPGNDPITQIQKLALQSPEPMKSWLNTIAAQTWNLMVSESAAHIETAWQKNIMPTYHTAIANRYPFNQTALNEVDLTQFSKFLGQQGSLSRFYHYYLKPFINENNNEWTFRELDNVKLPFSNTVLTQFKQLAMLQRAFFPNGDNKLYVQFTLQPIALDKPVKNFTLSINGQPVIYPKELTHTPHLLTWPGNNNNHMSGFHFVANDNHPLASTIQGDWGWFKLVNQFTQNINTRKELTLSFESNGHRAQYLLFTQGKLNPFLPLNLTRFELPEQLA